MYTRKGLQKWMFQRAQIDGHVVTFRKENGVNVEAVCKATDETYPMPWNKADKQVKS